MKRFALVAAAFFLCIQLFGQEVSEKQELAVFNVSHSGYEIPSRALKMVDNEIRDVFINIGRFDVIGLNYQFSNEEVDAYIERIREHREISVEIPEEVRLGEKAFTEADFNKLLNAFIVAVPSIVYFRTGVTRDGRFAAEMETHFTFINVEELKTFHSFTIRTIGLDSRSMDDAVREAAGDISLQLGYELKKIPMFQIKTGIIDVMGRDVLVEFGRDMGVRKGEEYSIVETRLLESGHTVTEETGLIVIKDVKDTVSVGRVIYSKDKPVVGDMVRELPRIGFDTSAYIYPVFDFTALAQDESTPANLRIPLVPAMMMGIRQSISIGMYRARPLIGVEIPVRFETDGDTVTSRLSEGFPMNFFIGGELNWYFWRFQAVPRFTTGPGGQAINGGNGFQLTHWGFKTGLTLNYLLGNRVRIGLEGGYTYWFGFDITDDYGGIFLGLGAQVRY